MVREFGHRRQLREVARAGDVGALRSLLRGLPPRSGGLLTPALHEAAGGGHAEAVRLLILHEADPSSSLQGESAAHRAAREGHVAVLQELWRGGANPGARNEAGKCAIAVAADAATREAIALEVQRRQGRAASKPPSQKPPAPDKMRSHPPELPPARLARARPAKHRGGVLGELTGNAASPQAPARCGSPGLGGRKRSPLGKEGQNQAGGVWGGKENDGAWSRPSPASPAAAACPQAPGKARLELTCSICLTGYCTEPRTAPVTLPCGHTFCERCVARLQGSKGSKAPADGFKTSFRCPLDRQVFSRNLKLSVNSILRDIIRDYGSLLSGCPQSSPRPSPVPPHRTASPGGVRPTARAGAKPSPVRRQQVDTATSPLSAECFKSNAAAV